MRYERVLMIDFKVSLSHRDSISLIATLYVPLYSNASREASFLSCRIHDAEDNLRQAEAALHTS